MERSYQIDPIPGGGWKLKLYEDGQEAGGGRGETDDDYQALIEAGEEFVGIDESSMRTGI